LVGVFVRADVGVVDGVFAAVFVRSKVTLVNPSRLVEPCMRISNHQVHVPAIRPAVDQA
jgi:hypothetical protein